MSLSSRRAQRGFSAHSACSARAGGRSSRSFSSRSASSFGGYRGGSRGRVWGAGGRPGGQFGGGSGGPGLSLCPPGGIQEVTINRSLLTPLKIGMDLQFQAVRTQETQEIRTLNNQFASFIDKVRLLEQQNKVLETKWHLLQQLGVSDRSQGLDSFFEALLAQLGKQLEQLQRERGALDAELKSCQDQEEEYKARYEQEANKHAMVENDFVVLKKYQELQASAQLHGNSMKETKVQISQLQRAIQSLQSQIENLKKQLSLEEAVLWSLEELVAWWALVDLQLQCQVQLWHHLEEDGRIKSEDICDILSDLAAICYPCPSPPPKSSQRCSHPHHPHLCLASSLFTAHGQSQPTGGSAKANK
ncbi:hypothetical protein MC885_017683 [Smutsia gigantea]|nr:hypothetical protein MC885_017683 [Smutsia gigantea]